MVEKLDIGISSYQHPDKLKRCIDGIEKNTRSDYRLFIIDNLSPDPKVRALIERRAAANPRIVPVYMTENTGYVGAVNHLLEIAETRRVAYLDNDAYIQTEEWDTYLMEPLLRHSEVRMTFPNGGIKPIKRQHYTEIMWGIGYCWMLDREQYIEIGGFDIDIGHQEEVDFQTRLRLAGYKMVSVPHVKVQHDATQSRDIDRRKWIDEGVRRWVDKWVAYFGGKHMNYHSVNVIRFDDWNCNALYLEEYYQQHLPDLNANPERIMIEGTPYDIIKVPRFPGLYKDRII